MALCHDGDVLLKSDDARRKNVTRDYDTLWKNATILTYLKAVI